MSEQQSINQAAHRLADAHTQIPPEHVALLVHEHEMANRVEVATDHVHAIAWQPGAETPSYPWSPRSLRRPLEYGGWVWHYDLEPVGADQTEVTLTYDWSRVPPHHRDIEFPPFGRQHLDNSLKHLAELAERA